MVKELEEMGYKVQVQPLSHFHEDYGLKGPESTDEDDSSDGDEEDDDESDADSSGEESGSDQDDL